MTAAPVPPHGPAPTPLSIPAEWPVANATQLGQDEYDAIGRAKDHLNLATLGYAFGQTTQADRQRIVDQLEAARLELVGLLRRTTS